MLWFQRSDATCSGQLVELHSHGALLVSGIVLVQQTLGSSLIHGLNGHLLSGIGLAAVAFGHRGLKLLQVGLQRGLLSLVLRRLGSLHQNQLFGSLDIGLTKHLLRCCFMFLRSFPSQICILA